MQMEYSSALEQLEEILNLAISRFRGIDDISTADVINDIMLGRLNSSKKESPISAFDIILNDALKELLSIDAVKKPALNIRISSILSSAFLDLKQPWTEASKPIVLDRVLESLHLLAALYKNQVQTKALVQETTSLVTLAEDSVNGLIEEFNSLLQGILDSRGSRKLKIFLVKSIEDILGALRQYQIDGDKGLERAVKSIIFDLTQLERQIDEHNKKDPFYKRFKVDIIALLAYLSSNAISLSGGIPAYDFWKGKYEEYQQGRDQIELIVSENPKAITIQEIIEEANLVFDREPPKQLEGQVEPKALPAGKDEEE